MIVVAKVTIAHWIMVVGFPLLGKCLHRQDVGADSQAPYLVASAEVALEAPWGCLHRKALRPAALNQCMATPNRRSLQA